MSYSPPRGIGSPFEEGAALRAFRAAYMNRYAKPVNIVVFGDSITQGFAASSGAQRWFDVFAARLCQMNGQQPHIGYVPMSNVTNYTDRQFTLTGWTERAYEGINWAGGTIDPASPGPAGTATYTTPQPCDRIWLIGSSYTSFVGSANISVDGGAAVTVNFVGASDKGGRVWDSGQLSRGIHSVSVTSPAGAIFGPVMEGAFFFDGNGPAPSVAGSGTGLITAANAYTGYGLRIWNASHTGYRTQHFAEQQGSLWFYDGFDTVHPDLVFILLGCNDEYDSRQVGTSTTITQYETWINQIITNINTGNTNNSLQPPSIVLIGMYGTGPTAGSMPPFNKAMRRVALQRGCAYIDWYELLGFVGLAASDVYDFMSALDDPSDQKHPADVGHAMLGDALAGWFANVVGPTGQVPRQPIRRITTAGRSVADATYNGTTAVSSASAAFVAGNYPTGDVNKVLVGPGIPAGTTLASRTSGTAGVMSAANPLSGTSMALSIMNPIPQLDVYADSNVIVDCTNGPAVIRLPDPRTNSAQELMIKKIDNTNNPIILYCTQGNIDNGAEYEVPLHLHSVTLLSEGGQWWCT